MHDLAVLGQAVHSLVDINEDMVFFGEREEVVDVDDLLEDHFDVDAYVFVSRRCGVQVEVLDVGGHELCAGGWRPHFSEAVWSSSYQRLGC